MNNLNKPICVIGFYQSTYTYAIVDMLASENISVKVIEPCEYFALTDKSIYQYVVGFTINQEERIKVIQDLDARKLDCFSFVHKNAQISTTGVNLGRGTFVWHSTSILHNTSIGNHCTIAPKTFISHEVQIGDNVLVWPDVSIGGRVMVGNNCRFNMKSAVLDKITICDNVEVGALSNITKTIDNPGLYCGHIARRVKDR